MEKYYSIAIDGPGGVGKSSTAKSIAGELGCTYIDTGAMYRAVGLKMLREGVPMAEDEALFEMLDRTDVDFSGGKVFLDGEDVSDLIRTQEVSKAASDCSAFRTVRVKLVELQQAMGAKKSIIMDGRDICTVVLKDAEYKYFLTATPEERAKRRYIELKAKGVETTFEEVLEDVNKRDYNDSHRYVDPLRKADDAEEIDSTFMSIDQVTDYIVSKVEGENK